MSDIANLGIKIDSTDAKNASKDLKELDKTAQETEKSASMMGKTIGTALVATAAAAVYMTKSSIDAADAMNDMHIKTGLAFKELAAYELLANKSGTTIGNVAVSFRNLSKYMVEHGDKLESIGVTSKDSNEAMGQFADLISGMKDPTLKTALAMEVLGKAGSDMIPFLEGGSAAFNEAITSSEEYSKILEKIAPLSDEFNDNMAEIATQAKISGASMAEYFLPALNEISKAFIDAKKEGNWLYATLVALGTMERKIVGSETDPQKIAQAEINELLKQSLDLKIKIDNFEQSGMGGTANVEALKKQRDAILGTVKAKTEYWNQLDISKGKEAESLRLAKEKQEADAAAMEQNIKSMLVAKKKKDEQDKVFETNEKTISQMKREADIYGYTAGQIQIYDSARAGANDRQIEEIIILSQAMDKRKEDAQLQEDIAKRQAEINKQYADDTAKANKKAAEESEKAWATFADQTQRVLGDVLYNGMVGKFQNIEEMFKEMILRMIANAAAAQAMMSLTSGAKSMMPSLLGAFTGGGQNYGSAGISEADWLSGARADGGPVTGGSSYLVGERGPEIFTPTTSGQITANGGGGVNITDNTVINIDSRSDRMQVLNDVNKMIEQGNSRLVDRLQRQGQLA